ncbi:MAG: NADPH dependent preQ0 reductase (EC [uncultured Sulfurovum sp.]|uniref:NADPH-dependent 7-cyano-7-deazaguanine reductase n=1 Tax=uncultured Sulfurovum sp. TaxID=269237 RepID=A0A6S6U368_9BACT|nr:MAG: NADPH dependent preQ0 reductase (EC [uncultured Sulfurovum sp.]
MAQENREKELSSLGSNGTSYEYHYNPKLLETFENLHQENDYWVTLNADEFTSLCPITNQPDFGTLIINYIPNINMVESKSLKLYLFSFINNGEFHEDVVNKIGKDLVKLMNPKYLEVVGLFYPRGNISIHPTFSYNNGKKKYKKLEKYRFINRNLHPQRIG